MIDFFCNIYTYVSYKHAFLRKTRIEAIIRAITRFSANIVLPLHIQCTNHIKKYALNPEIRNTAPIIVSFTSFPARINRTWLVVESLLRQTVKPDKIILWLAKEQFDGFHSLPKKILRLQSRGLEIRFVEEDIRSHKKYAYAIREYPDAIIVTVDDDVFYPSHMLQYLLEAHTKHPNDVIANITHQLQYKSSGELLSYADWKHNITLQDYSNNIFQVGVGGVLYPPHCAHPDICNAELAYRVCPFGDDIWLYAMCRLVGTTIRTSSSTFVPLPIYNLHNVSLSTENLLGRNDSQIQQITTFCIEQYGKNPFEQ